jgi:malonyl CoA-acyl carrier protein transacylase
MSSTEIVVSSKETFAENVRRWVLLDTQLKMINEKTKEMRDAKHKSGDIICEYMKSNGIQDKKIEIHDGDLKIYEKKEYPPLTYSYIEECLDKIIANKSQVEYILKFLKENREIKKVQDIRRNFK